MFCSTYSIALLLTSSLSLSPPSLSSAANHFLNIPFICFSFQVLLSTSLLNTDLALSMFSTFSSLSISTYQRSSLFWCLEMRVSKTVLPLSLLPRSNSSPANFRARAMCSL